MYPVTSVVIVVAMCLIHFIRFTSAVAICVPRGTCINRPGTGTGTNPDPRIQTPGGGGTNPLACGPNQESCEQSPIACGRRYVTSTGNYGTSVLGEIPWQVYLTQNDRYIGSGVLIDDKYVLTAAHKVDDNNFGLRIYIGVWRDRSEGLSRTARIIRIHPGYNKQSKMFHDDLALIRLDQPVPLGYQTNIVTGCMPDSGKQFVGAAGCVVAGWGETRFGAADWPTNPQKKVQVPIVSYDTCLASMQRADVLGASAATYLQRDKQLCAGGQAEMDACTNDGGAPLMCPNGAGNFEVAGIVLWGKGCGRQGVYGVYAAISAYRAWIAETIINMNSVA